MEEVAAALNRQDKMESMATVKPLGAHALAMELEELEEAHQDLRSQVLARPGRPGQEAEEEPSAAFKSTPDLEMLKLRQEQSYPQVLVR